MGIEPTAQAWEAWVLPLYDARRGTHSMRLSADLQSFAAKNRSFMQSEIYDSDVLRGNFLPV